MELLRRDVITGRTVEILDRFRHPGFSVYVGRPVAADDRAGCGRAAWWDCKGTPAREHGVGGVSGSPIRPR